jgi:hypothetical protein
MKGEIIDYNEKNDLVLLWMKTRRSAFFISLI